MNSRKKAELYLLSCTIIWGGTFVVVKGGLEDSSPLLFIALRFTIAALLFGLFGFKFLHGINRGVLIGGGILGILLFAGFVAQTVGLLYTTASKSAFITGLMVVFTPIFQLLIERRPPKAGNVAGVVLVTAGLYFLTSPEGSEFNIGDALTLLCAAVFGLYIVYLDIFTKRHDVYQIAFLQFVLTAACAIIGALLCEEMFLRINSEFLLGLSYLALLATLFTLTVQTKYQKDTTPTRAAIIFSLEPVFAAVFAFFVLGEVIGAVGILGGGLIVSGLLVSELSPA